MMYPTKQGYITLLFFSFLFFTTIYQGFAQNRFLETDVSMHYGYILKGQQNVRHLAISHPVGFNFSVYQITTGRLGWESAFRHPKIGVSFQFLDYNNPILGKSFAIVPNMKFNWIKKGRHQLEFKIGTGLAVFTNYWKLDSNPKNTMISHPLNFSMQFALIYSYRISPSWHLRLGTELIHYSNAAFTLPNAGINVNSLSFGFYYQHKAKNLTYETQLMPYQKDWFLQASGMFSAVERVPAQGYKNRVWGLMLLLGHRINRKSILHAGLDYSENTAIQAEIDEKYQYSTDAKPDFRRLSFLFGHEWLAGRVALITDIGIYLYRPYNTIDAPFYQRLGLKYYFSKDLSWWAHFGIKTHYGAAEYTEWMVGYNFRKKKKQ